MASSHVLLRTGSMTALCLTGALLLGTPARANVLFDFSGDCFNGCTGTAAGVLSLADSYTFGADITAANFISFQYSSSQFSFDIESADSPSFDGGLNADGSLNSEGMLEILGSTSEFQSSDAKFEARQRPGVDVGFSPTFILVGRAVPEPSTWAMMLLGFAGLGFAGYRKVREKKTALAKA